MATAARNAKPQSEKAGKVVEAFKKGRYNVMVGTQVAEEGLDIGSVDLVCFLHIFHIFGVIFFFVACENGDLTVCPL